MGKASGHRLESDWGHPTGVPRQRDGRLQERDGVKIAVDMYRYGGPGGTKKARTGWPSLLKNELVGLAAYLLTDWRP